MTFGSSSAPGNSLSSSGSPGKFVFYTGMIVSTVLPSLVPLRHIDDCFAITENFVICCNQVTEMFRSRHDCTGVSSARSPRYFRLQADITIWVLRESAYTHVVLTRTWFHFCSRLHWKFMRLLGKCLDFLALGFLQASVEVLSSTKFSLNSCSQSGNACDISLCTSSDSPF